MPAVLLEHENASPFLGDCDGQNPRVWARSRIGQNSQNARAQIKTVPQNARSRYFPLRIRKSEGFRQTAIQWCSCLLCIPHVTRSGGLQYHTQKATSFLRGDYPNGGFSIVSSGAGEASTKNIATPQKFCIVGRDRESLRDSGPGCDQICYPGSLHIPFSASDKFLILLCILDCQKQCSVARQKQSPRRRRHLPQF